MKHEKAWTALTGAMLAFLAGWGTVGCLISALSLPLSHPAKLTLVCAGMGADTMISILSAAPWLKDAHYRLILQCQSRYMPVMR